MKNTIKPPTFWERILHFKCEYVENGMFFFAGYMGDYSVYLQPYKCRVCGKEKTESV